MDVQALFHGKRCTLVDMEERFLEEHVSYLNDPSIHECIATRPPFFIDQQKKWLQQNKEKGNIVKAILVPVGSELDRIHKHFVGVVELRDIDMKTKTAVTASMIGDKSYWGKGIVYEARMLLLRYAFEHLELEQIYSTTREDNVRSQRSLERAGYRRADSKTKVRELNGKKYDEYAYTISRQDWGRAWKAYMSQLTS